MPRIRSYHLYLPHVQIDTGTNMRLLYALRIARDFVSKFSFFFLPIYLFELGQTVRWFDAWRLSTLQQGMMMLAIFFIIMRTLAFLLGVPTGRFLAKIGYQKGLVLGSVMQALSFVTLYATQQQPMLIFVAMLTEAIQLNLFWNSFHTVLSKSMIRNRVGQDLSTIQFMLQLLSAVIPAISGALALAFGFNVLFLAGILGTLVSALFALNLKLGKEHDQVSWGEFWQWLSEPSYRRLSLSFIGRYANDTMLFVWPLYVFLIFGSIEKVGFLYTLSLFLALVVTFFTGFYLRTTNSRKPFFLSGSFLSLLWFLRMHVITPWAIAFVDTADKLAANFHWLYFDSLFMRRGKGHQALSYFVYREMVMSAGGVVFWVIFALVFLFSQLGWNTLFVLAAVGVLLSLLVRDTPHE